MAILQRIAHDLLLGWPDHRMPGNLAGRDQGVTQVTPTVKTSLQRTHALDSQLLQLLRHPGAGRFAGSSAIENDVLVLGKEVRAGGHFIGQYPQRPGQSARVGNRVEGMPQVEDHQGATVLDHPR